MLITSFASLIPGTASPLHRVPIRFPPSPPLTNNPSSKENTVLRAALDPTTVSVIPNAVVAENFRPDPARASPKNITIVVISRLFYNKGTDLLVAAIPRICSIYPTVRFIVAGSGPKAIDLEQMIEKHQLQDRVEMLGPIRHEEVRDVMVRGHIYLHPSLTEAFGTVIVEAASCGLYVVCTRVGGIPEVLPSHMTVFARPEEDDLVNATCKAITAIRRGAVQTGKFHDQVKQMYSWTDVAMRTERVYDMILKRENDNLLERLKKYYGCGIWAGKLFVICVVVDYLIWVALCLIWPEKTIDKARLWPRKKRVDDVTEGGGIVMGSVDTGRKVVPVVGQKTPSGVAPVGVMLPEGIVTVSPEREVATE
jgi:phosphatidylinositol N-acetylglucosaminyltransferase subunit A